MRTIERTDDTVGRGGRRLGAGARLAQPRRPRDHAAPAEPRLLPDLGRRVTRRCCSASPAICAPATTGSSPTTATVRSRSRSASRRTRCCCRPSARPTIPPSGGRQMPCHWGARELNIVSQTSCTGSQCLPAVGCAEAARYIGRRPHLPGCVAYGDELTYVSLGDGATSEGEFWESLNTACRLHLPVLYVVADNGYAISVRLADQAPAPISEMVRGIRGLHVVKMDGRDYFEVRREGRRRDRARACRCRPVPRPRARRPGRTRTRSPTTRRSTAAPRSSTTKPRTIRSSCSSSNSSSGARSTEEQIELMRADAKATVRAAAEAALAPRRDPSSPACSTTWSRRRTVTALPDRSASPIPTPRRSPSARRSGSRCTSRWRPTSASACSAKTSPTPTRTSSTKCRAKAACSASRSACSARSATPAASTRRSPRRTSSAARSARRCAACVRAPRSSSSTTCGPR